MSKVHEGIRRYTYREVSLEYKLKHLITQASKYVDEIYSYIRLNLYWTLLEARSSKLAFRMVTKPLQTKAAICLESVNGFCRQSSSLIRALPTPVSSYLSCYAQSTTSGDWKHSSAFEFTIGRRTGVVRPSRSICCMTPHLVVGEILPYCFKLKHVRVSLTAGILMLKTWNSCECGVSKMHNLG